MVSVGSAMDERDSEPEKKGFQKIHNDVELVKALSYLARGQACPHGPDFFRDISEFRAGRDELSAIGDMDLKTFGVRIIDDDPFKLDLVVERIGDLNEDDRVVFGGRSLQFDLHGPFPGGKVETEGFVSLPIQPRNRVNAISREQIERD